jgi:uncharacterized BrkB/YihY/UPF0761 family membrane protein
MTVDEAFNVLDRVIGFINNCDNKASIVLGSTVAILAIIFSSEGIRKIVDIISAILFSQTGKPSIGEAVYLVLLIVSLALLLIGLVYLVLTIIARIKTSGSSAIYFGHITQLKDATAYKERVLSSTKEELLEDILNQIYINSSICSCKYKHYNRGLKYTVIGFTTLIAILAIGVFSL